ncbi:uncharacterized protein LOC117561664 isoform X1 [Gymnodraco acuticeps]|uniref:Uncharacterized protein LOC117561664 isoform X1 n=1 Tax=Gymnodraco acuticeps TaxID=8218 RepID=A0A6P8VVI5_GYMAC|nr:uncharacterized protein LOC117561664 isoform X1 [Gymnodraco acuticeps]
MNVNVNAENMHITIREGRSLPDLQRCTTCCNDFHCPFCVSRLFSPTKHCKVKSHLESHFQRAVLHEGYTIHRCGLNCRPDYHFHCCYCQSMHTRKSGFVKHLALCKAKHSAITPIIPDPAIPIICTSCTNHVTEKTWGLSISHYTLSIVTNAGFQFQERDMPLIRKWWCLLLMELFEIQGHGQRFAFWTLEARSLLEGTLQPIFRVPRPEREQQTPPHPQ